MNLLPVAIVLALSVYLAFHPEYEDGIIGKAALGCMAIAAMVILGEQASGVDRGVTADALAWWGMAGFLARHTYRFWSFVRICRVRPQAIPEFLRK